MTPLELHAIALARAGQWQLLDALEVVARARTEAAFAGMLHTPGDLALLGYLVEVADAHGGEAPCPECDGDGEVEVVGATGRSRYMDCPWCDGAGTVDAEARITEMRGASQEQVREWRTLSGEVVPALPWRMGSSPGWLSPRQAERIVADYRPLVERLAVAA